ncbi:MAG: FAD-dependent oxidoreductase [Acetobacteraceae bacterium]
MRLSRSSVTIVGAGLTGPLLALMLARRGLRVTLYERRPDPRHGKAEAGRSINLALAARGIGPLERCGLLAQVMPILVPMRGRLLHEPSGATQLQPYGQRAGEIIHSVSRAALNRVLVDAAERAGAELHFGQRCVGVDATVGRLQLVEERSGRRLEASCDVIVGADGAGSPIRSSLAAAEVLDVRVDQLDHDYREMTIPAVEGTHALRADALHIWPRGGFMLIALPNCDGSFTVTLFLGRTGRQSFAALNDEAEVRRFFLEQFPDLEPHVATLAADFRRNPQGYLATVHASSWHFGGKVLVIGDAAHAIVPFHGQGMNAAFEDCAVLDQLLDRHGDWQALFEDFERRRRPDTDAIAEMALENYVEMRDTVRDPQFKGMKKLAFELERRFPDRFIPRYSMVMFHPEIPYAEALRRGRVQSSILKQLNEQPMSSGYVDMALAESLVQQLLPRVASLGDEALAGADGR